jgi:hypothetical protein
MQRSKSVALAFLLGAVVVGGSLGFTADRVWLRERICQQSGNRADARSRLARDLGLTAAQRATLDSLLDRRHDQMSAVVKQIRPQMDSVRDRTRQDIIRMLNPEQQARFEAMLKQAHEHEGRERQR